MPGRRFLDGDVYMPWSLTGSQRYRWVRHAIGFLRWDERAILQIEETRDYGRVEYKVEGSKFTRAGSETRWRDATKADYESLTQKVMP